MAKNSASYENLIRKMLEEDEQRINFSREVSNELSSIKKLIGCTVEWPAVFIYPMFEIRAAFSVPANYYQPLFFNNEKCGVSFSHGSTRSVFFIDTELMLISKTVSFKDGKEFFTSFVITHFDKNEYSYSWEGENLKIAAAKVKKFRNLINDKTEDIPVSFNFLAQSVKNRIISKEQVASSAQFKSVYSRFGSITAKTSSIDLEGYAITVPHFSPHPYLLHLHKEFGFGSNREFQERGVLEYFRAHLL